MKASTLNQSHLDFFRFLHLLTHFFLEFNLGKGFYNTYGKIKVYHLDCICCIRVVSFDAWLEERDVLHLVLDKILLVRDLLLLVNLLLLGNLLLLSASAHSPLGGVHSHL